MLDIQEHTSPSYSPRTYANAAGAELTVAFAVDFSTAGEKLTHKAAGDRYVGIPLGSDPVEAARALYRALRDRNAHTLNVAGNGIYTLALHGWTQRTVNEWVHEVLSKVNAHWPLTAVRSGGQTGVDLAGVVSAHVLGIDSLMLLPKGFTQRGTDKIDKLHTAEEIRAQVEHWANALRQKPEVAALVQRTLEAPQTRRPRGGQEAAQPGSVRVVSKRKGGVAAEPGETVIDGDREDPVFGNRHILHNHRDDDERAQVIHQHLVEDYEPDVLAGGPIYRKMVGLAERVAAGERIAIACWCAPRSCHCDNYAAGIDMLARGIDLQAEVRATVEARASAPEPEPSTELDQIHFDFSWG
ncbi:DUF4326 domain-containing protein [Geopseudomonas aromaticivorans]